MTPLILLMVASVGTASPAGTLTMPPLDYPADALKNREQGEVGYSVDLTPQGTVSNCHVTKSSGSARLDRATCAWLRRATAKPARRAGVAVADTKIGTIAWTLPPAPAPQPR